MRQRRRSRVTRRGASWSGFRPRCWRTGCRARWVCRSRRIAVKREQQVGARGDVQPPGQGGGEARAGEVAHHGLAEAVGVVVVEGVADARQHAAGAGHIDAGHDEVVEAPGGPETRQPVGRRRIARADERRPAKRRCSSAAPKPASQSAAASDGSPQRRLTAPVGPSKSKSRFGLKTSQRYPPATPMSKRSPIGARSSSDGDDRAEVAAFGRDRVRRLERLVIGRRRRQHMPRPTAARHASDDCAMATFSLRASAASNNLPAAVADRHRVPGRQPRPVSWLDSTKRCRNERVSAGSCVFRICSVRCALLSNSTPGSARSV